MTLSTNPESEEIRDFLNDVIITAIEGGAIDHWAIVTDYEIDADGIAHAPAVEEEASGETAARFTINQELIRKGIEKATATDFKINPTSRSYLESAVDNIDAGSIDIEIADIIIQAAVFGRIIYS